MKQESANEIKERSKVWIEQALFRLLEKYPYDRISVTMICDEADLTRQTFYRLYDTKDDVIRYYMISVFNTCYRQLELIESPTLKSCLECYFMYWRKKQSLIYLLKNHNLETNTLRANLMLVDKLESLTGEKYSNITKRVLAGAIYSCTTYWIDHEMIEDEKEIINEMLSRLRI